MTAVTEEPLEMTPAMVVPALSVMLATATSPSSATKTSCHAAVLREAVVAPLYLLIARQH